MEQMKMEVMRLHKLNGEGPVKAFCDLGLNSSFVVKGFKVVEGKEGLFVGLPSDLGKDGKWYSTFVPLSKEVRDELDRIVLEAYAQ